VTQLGRREKFIWISQVSKRLPGQDVDDTDHIPSWHCGRYGCLKSKDPIGCA